MSIASLASRASSLDQKSAVFSAASLVSIALLVGGVQPLVLGALAGSYGFPDRDLGYFSSASTAFGTLVMVAGPFWIRHVNWKVITAIGLAGWMVSMTLGAFATTFWSVIGIFSLLGFFGAFISMPSFALLGDTSNPDKAYGLSVTLQAVSAAAASGLLAYLVIPRYGAPGVFVALAVVTALGFGLVLWLPRGGRREVMEQDAPDKAPHAVPILSKHAIPAFIALFAVGFFIGGLIAFFFFVERIGAWMGVSMSAIGFTLTVTALFGIVSASIATYLGGRVSTIRLLFVGAVLLVITYPIMLVGGATAYFVANLISALGWGVSQPGYWALLSKVDHTARLFPAAQAAGGIGGIVAGILAGPVIETAGYVGLMGFSAFLFVAAFVAIVLAERVSGRFALNPTHIPA